MAVAKYKKGTDGRYQARVWDGTFFPDGRKRRKTIYSTKSSKDLEEKVIEFQLAVKNKKNVKQIDDSFLEYARRWVKLYKSSLETGTQKMYLSLVERHMDVLQYVRVSDLDKVHILEALKACEDRPRTQEQLLMMLKQIVKAAVSENILPAGCDTSLFSGIRLKKHQAKEKRALTPEEKEAVFSANFTDREKAFVYVIYSFGLRRGEALALTVKDFDFDRNVLTVNKALAYDKDDKPYIKGTKSANGIRKIPLLDKTKGYLQEYCGNIGDGYLFTSKGSDLMTKDAYRRMWEYIQTKMGSPELTAHIFRHNFCANLCYQVPRISLKKVAELLGDTDKMVIEVYNHVISEKDDASGAMAAALT